MPTLVLDKRFLSALSDLDPVVQKRVADLPSKFEEAAHTGVHLEKLNAAIDDRIRTVRINDAWRGVVAALGGGRYALLRVMHHDDAIRWATRQRLGVNPVTGIVELIDVATASERVEAIAPASDGDAALLFEDVPNKSFRQLGVDEDLVPLLRRIRTEEELIPLASVLPKAQGDAILLLASGMTADEAWAEIAADYAVADEPIDPNDIDTALERTATKAEFLVTTSDDELRELLTGDFEAWRTFLHPAQRTLAEKPTYRGPAKVTGGAGTGKTVVAMHRARYLARRRLEAGDTTSRILVATYTNSLAKNLERSLKRFCSKEEFERIHVSTVDALAYRTAAADGARMQPVQNPELDELAEIAASMASLDTYDLDGAFLLAEWRHVVLARNLSTLAEYATTPRPGRGKALPRPHRKAVWSGIRALIDLLDDRHLATYLQIADRATEAMASGSIGGFHHVIVDEAQDLHPAQWRFLRAAVPAGENDLFIVGDAHQRIYDDRVSLSRLGIETRGRSRRLRINYRTSQQILSWSMAILEGQTIDDLDGAPEDRVGYRSELDGPPPVVRAFESGVEEAQFVVDTIRRWRDEGIPDASIGVVGRTNAATLATRSALDAREVPWRELGSDRASKGVYVGTMHASKGLEFARLIVVGVNEDLVPLPMAVADPVAAPERHALDMLRERCLLYVACTRARDALTVTGYGRLSPLLPTSTES